MLMEEAGWYGKQGSGVVRHYMCHHERLVIAASLSKSFGTAGGVFVFAVDGFLGTHCATSVGRYKGDS